MAIGEYLSGKRLMRTATVRETIHKTGPLFTSSKFDYRKKINEMIEQNRSVRGYRTKLARAADMQLSYLLAVCKGQSRLSPDQAVDLCEYWGFDKLRTEQFVLLVLLEKSTSPGWKGFLLTRLKEIEAKLQTASKKAPAKRASSPRKRQKKPSPSAHAG